MITKIKDIEETLLKNKPFFLGLAMIVVVLYHFYNVSTAWHPYMKLLIPGFIGVDWFMFFSGYSLCYSWVKNSIGVFYSRRAKRIIPMYLVFSILATFLFALLRLSGGGGGYCIGSQRFILDLLCNITTLNYYGVGGFFLDWYLPAIILFYLFFPLLYHLNISFKFSPIVLALICGSILYLTDLKWWFDVAIARIPIFCLGILFFVDQSENRKTSLFSSWAFLVLFFIGIVFRLRGCFLTDMVSPVVMLLIAYVVNKHLTILTSKAGRAIIFIGKHSLEIYIGNVLSCIIIGSFSFNQVVVLVLYITLNILISSMMILVNNGIGILFNRNNKKTK